MPDHCLGGSNSSRALTSAGTAASVVAIVTASSLESRSCAIVIMRAITRDEEHFLPAPALAPPPADAPPALAPPDAPPALAPLDAPAPAPAAPTLAPALAPPALAPALAPSAYTRASACAGPSYTRAHAYTSGIPDHAP
jgi:hypothetical protein